MDIRKLFVLTQPVEQCSKRRLSYLLLSLLCAVIGGVLTYTYRPFVYANHINDWHLADTIGNIAAIPAAAFLFYAAQKTVRYSKLAVLAFDFLAWCLYEAVFSLTFDWWDILASLVMCFVTYPLFSFLEKHLP